MNKIIRIGLLVVSFIIYFGIIYKASSMTSAIGIILLVAVLLMSMESVRRKRDKIFTLKSEVKEIDDMDQETFAQYIAELFKRLDYYVKPIPKDKNQGADLVVRKEKQVICIRCGIQGEDTLALLQQVYGSMSYFKAKKSLFITNQYIGEDARQFAKRNKVQLVDRDQLINMIQQVIKNDKTSRNELKAQEA